MLFDSELHAASFLGNAGYYIGNSLIHALIHAEILAGLDRN